MKPYGLNIIRQRDLTVGARLIERQHQTLVDEEYAMRPETIRHYEKLDGIRQRGYIKSLHKVFSTALEPNDYKSVAYQKVKILADKVYNN